MWKYARCSALFWQQMQQDSCRQDTAEHNAACWHVGAAAWCLGGVGLQLPASAVQLLNGDTSRQEHAGHSAVRQNTGGRVMTVAFEPQEV